ncbi:MAG: hypothetical protein M1836_003605 [Candelina mexicana]|nr:MAG: hypothetical protein M1836_003605 [Candelina mexicana]
MTTATPSPAVQELVAALKIAFLSSAAAQQAASSAATALTTSELRFRPEEVGFFEPQAEQTTPSDIEQVGKNIYLHDVRLFLSRARTVAKRKGEATVSAQLDSCLRGSALSWFMTLIVRHAQGADMLATVQHVNWAWKNLDPELQDSMNKPGDWFTVTEFIKKLNNKKENQRPQSPFRSQSPLRPYDQPYRHSNDRRGLGYPADRPRTPPPAGHRPQTLPPAGNRPQTPPGGRRSPRRRSPPPWANKSWRNDARAAIQQPIPQRTYPVPVRAHFRESDGYAQLPERYDYEEYNSDAYLSHPDEYSDEVDVSFSDTQQHGLPAFSCKRCLLSFSNTAQLRAHLRDFHANSYPCTGTGCSKSFPLKTQLDEHLRAVRHE